jgi:acetyl esterase/lipase
MKLNYLLSILSLCLLTGVIFAQKEISLPMPIPSGSVKWTQPERQYFSKIFQTEVVTNVSQPKLIAYLPKNPNGTAVIICPGGGFHALSINSEGIDAAKWLNEKGITAFVLKYRLVPSKTEDAVQELMGMIGDRKKLDEVNTPVVPLSLSDGLTAISYVRKNAKKFGINPNQIGIIGFSAGGTVAANVAFNYKAENRPDFVAPIHPYMGALKETNVPADAPPLFVLVASNDQLGLAPDSINLYNKWLAAKKTAELHSYSEGGHGFGMRKQNLPSDNWIELFYAFLNQEVIKKK